MNDPDHAEATTIRSQVDFEARIKAALPRFPEPQARGEALAKAYLRIGDELEPFLHARAAD